MGTTESRPCVVIDPGSGVLKYGIASQETLGRIKADAEAAIAAAGSGEGDGGDGASGGGAGGAGIGEGKDGDAPLFHTIPAVIGRRLKAGEKRPEDGVVTWSAWFGSLLGGGAEEEREWIGQEALDDAERENLVLYYPTEEAQVKPDGWPALKKLFAHLFDKLSVADDLANHNVLLTEPPMSSNDNRLMFMRMILGKPGDVGERSFPGGGFGCAGFWMGTQAVLAKVGYDVPRAAPLETAMVLDVGDGLSHVIPVHHNVPMLAQARQVKLAGRHVTVAFERVLAKEHGLRFERSRQREAARMLKERVAVVPTATPGEDGAAEGVEDVDVPSEPVEMVDNLPIPAGLCGEGNVAGLPLKRVSAQARWSCGDLLFAPSHPRYRDFMDPETVSVSRLVLEQIKASPSELRDGLRTIVLSGGTTLMRGFAERLRRDVEAGLGTGRKVTVLCDPGRHGLVYRGAVAMAVEYIKDPKPEEEHDAKAKLHKWMTAAEFDDRRERKDGVLLWCFADKCGPTPTTLR
uniref:Actin-related protein 8 n=1 Tax=Bicosoecida sp. CB-2014 TaxID=1486930 RepID=A0A7S1CR01_9STRA|mmetsp:Transcript_7915/g.28106  ORF Transcript_7915/g.28106 Transcript_7915/m.28106 type:complete len:518 (+) Transcript_7915:206-1759(+)